MDAPRYVGIPTFMRAPFASDPSDLDIALIGIPYDGAVTNRPGARHGPREIRNVSSQMRAIHHVTRINPFALCRVGDVGDVPLSRVYEVEASLHEIADFCGLVCEAGAVPLSAGGDHSISLPLLRAVSHGAGPVGLVHLDAHTDTWDEFMHCRYNHGTPFRRAVEEGLLDPARTVQIGIRGAQNTTEGWDYSAECGMRVMFIEEAVALGPEAVATAARRVVGDGPTYISFDIDCLDPAFAPGTGTPEVGGFTPLQVQGILRGLRGLHLVGADVVEVCPPFDPTGGTALLGATILYELLCLLAESVAGRH